MTTKIYTDEQKNIFDAVENSDCNIVVNALAGTGKTTTAVEVVNRLPKNKRLGFCAFNKHIANELSSRLGSKAECRTLHSFGFRELSKRFFPTVEDRKVRKIVRMLTKNTRMSAADKLATEDLVYYAKMLFCELTILTADEITRRFGLSISDHGMVLNTASRALEISTNDTNTIDYADMIYLPLALKMQMPEFDFLVGDESQDWNPCQQKLALALCPSKRMMPIGDVNQSIYSFSGADPDSIPNLTRRLRSRHTTRELPLTMTWRCPKSHVELAKQIVPEFRAHPSAMEGFHDVESESWMIANANVGDMILCRTNAPLVKLAYTFIKGKRPVHMRGRDIGRGLITLLDSLFARDIQHLGKRLAEFEENETARLTAKDADEAALESLRDRCECLAVFMGMSSTLDEMRRHITDLFTDDESPENYINLSSIHKAKGLEAERVFIVEPERLPLKWKDQTDVEAQQELNILYVALTRSKSELYFIGGMPHGIE